MDKPHGPAPIIATFVIKLSLSKINL